jgi:hypothetical protein
VVTGITKPMTQNEFRRIALGMDGAVEGAHMGHPDFRARGRIFATLRPELKSGMVGLTPEQQQEFIQAHPGTFSPEVGAWGRAGATRVILAGADVEAVGEAVTLAWQNVIEKAAKRKPSASRSAAKRPSRK